jgi:hypothetical protein
MRTGLGDHFSMFNPSFVQQRAHRCGVAYAIPGVEAFIEIGPRLTNRVPERRSRRFEETRASCSDSKLTARANHMPKRPYRSRHIGDKENTKYADNRMKLGFT